MKKIRIIQFVGTILFVIYVVLLIIEIQYNYFANNSILYFSVLLAIISLNMINKGVVLHSSSTQWFGIVLIMYAIVMILLRLGMLTINQYYIFSVIPIIPSVILLAVFKNPLYIKVIILNIFIVIPIIIWQRFHFGVWQNIINFGLGIVLSIVICRNINFDRENV